LEILKKYYERFKAIFHCFVLMDDHYHLLLEVIKLVCEYYRISGEDLKKQKKNNIPKKLAMYLIYQQGGLSNKNIASLFGGIHYSAISHCVRRVRETIKKDKNLFLKVEKLERRLKKINKSHFKT